MLARLRANIAATILGLLSAILLALCVYQAVTINGFLWIDGLRDQIEDCARDRNELRAIANEKNEQKETTGRTIGEAEQGNREAEERAREIEKAPLPGNCATPQEIMGADL